MNLQEITKIGFNALKEAYFVQRRLYEDGSIGDIVNVGTGEDQATKGDLESEKAVINYLRERKFPGVIVSEEHGRIELGEEYLAILDGIDGSSKLVKDINSRCGTILTIADNLEPRYKDFVFSGVTEYVTDRICFGTKVEGIWIMDNPGNKEKWRRVSKFDQRPFSQEDKIKIDCYEVDYAPGITAGIDDFKRFMNENVSSKLEGKMQLTGSITGSEMTFDLLEGKVDAVAHVVAKGTFEPPNFYFFARELGGVGIDRNGNELGERKWVAAGNNVDSYIFTRSKEVGDKIAGYLNE